MEVKQENKGISLDVTVLLCVFGCVIIIGNFTEYQRINLLSLTPDKDCIQHYSSWKLHE